MSMIWNFIKGILVSRWTRMLVGTLLLLIVVYYIAGSLHLEGENRKAAMYLVAGLVGTFVLVQFFRELWISRKFSWQLKSQARVQAARKGPESQQDLEHLERIFQQAFDELARVRPTESVFKPGTAGALPWVIVLGPPGAGKTTALQNSGLRFTRLGRRVQGIGGTRNCTWWLAEEAIFLDTAGRYTTQEEDHEEWIGFLRMLEQNRRGRPIDTAVLQIGVDTLDQLSIEAIEDLAFQLQQRLDELSQNLLIRFPIHLVFSKCDRIEGFDTFFGSLAREDRTQPWGFRLDTQTLASEPIADAFEARFEAMLASLTERARVRVPEVLSREEREAVLCFPREFGRRRDKLQAFTEVLFEPSRHRERPWLSSIFFISGTQEGPGFTGVRHQVAREFGVAAPPPLAAKDAVGSFFVKGMFDRVVKQAQAAAMPTNQALRTMRIRQLIAMAVVSPACFFMAWLLGTNYFIDGLWIERVRTATYEMATRTGMGGITTDVTREEIFAELTRMTTTRDLLLQQQNLGLLATLHDQASRLLRLRIDRELLVPLEPAINGHLQNSLDWERRQSWDDFAQGYLALKADYVVRLQICPGADPVVTRAWMGSYAADLWKADLGEKGTEVLVGDTSETIQTLVSYYFEGTVPSRLTPAGELIEKSRQALQGQAPTPEVVFNLIVSNAGLASKVSQIDSRVFNDPLIREVFTAEGCQKFKGAAGVGQEWWGCILGISANEGSDRDSIYMTRFKEARQEWLNNVTLAKPIKEPKDARFVLDALDKPNSDLDQILTAMGELEPPRVKKLKHIGRGEANLGGRVNWLIGCARRTESLVVEAEKAMPSICQQTVAPFSAYAMALAEPDKGGNVYSAYQKYRLALQAFNARLTKVMESKNGNQDALLVMQQTMMADGELFALMQARKPFISRVKEGPPETAPDSLGLLLESIERQIGALLVPMAAMGLQEQWQTGIYGKWTKIRYNSALLTDSEAAACQRIIQFVQADMESYVQQVLAPFFAGGDVEACRINDFLGESLPINQEICYRIKKARAIAPKVQCPAPEEEPSGAEEPGPAPIKISTDMRLLVNSGTNASDCSNPLEWVEIDTGKEVIQCRASTSTCLSRPSRSSGRVRITLKQKNQAETNARWKYDADSFEELMQSARATQSGDNIRFNQSGPNCPDLGFTLIVPGSAPQTGGGSKKPVKIKDNSWKQISLPSNIVTR